MWSAGLFPASSQLLSGGIKSPSHEGNGLKAETISRSILLQVQNDFLYVCVQGLSLVLSEGGLKDGEERDQPMEEDSADAELLPGYQWLLQDLPKLPLFDSVRGMTSTALQQVTVSMLGFWMHQFIFYLINLLCRITFSKTRLQQDRLPSPVVTF